MFLACSFKGGSAVLPTIVLADAQFCGMRTATVIAHNLRTCHSALNLLTEYLVCASASEQSISRTVQQQVVIQASSNCFSPLPWSFQHVRHMSGPTHKLSLKRANNRASWKAVQPFLQQQQPAQQGDPVVRSQRPTPIATAIPELPQLQEPTEFRKIGKLTGPYSITQQAAFAVIQTGGSQFKVTTDDVIYHNKMDLMVNDVVRFGKVLLLGTQQETTIGRPFIPEACVIAAVEENFKDAKVHVFKKKKRKGYSKLKGFRAQMTALRILEIRAPGQQIPTASNQQQTKLPKASLQLRSNSTQPSTKPGNKPDAPKQVKQRQLVAEASTSTAGESSSSGNSSSSSNAASQQGTQ